MPTFGAELIGGFVFSSIGLIAFVYGKRMHVWKPMFIGLVMVVRFRGNVDHQRLFRPNAFEAVQHARRLFDQAHARTLGIVFNKISGHLAEGYCYYGRGYYGEEP